MKKMTIILIAVVSIGLGFLPTVIKDNSTLTILSNVLLYVALASSWNILGGFAGQISLGHSAFFGLGALVTRLLWFAGWPLLVALFLGGIVAVLFALLIGYPAFKLKGAYFTIGTLALSQILFMTIGNIFAASSALPIEILRSYSIVPRYILFLSVAVITVFTSYFLAKSSFGLGMQAVREEEDAAESLGVNAFQHKLTALLVSSFLAGLAGGAFAFYHVGYYPYYPFNPIWSLDSQMMAFIGGTGTIIGPIIGAVFFELLKEFLSLRLPKFHLTVFGVLFILVVLFLPEGLVGIWSKIKGLRIFKPKQSGEPEVL